MTKRADAERTGVGGRHLSSWRARRRAKQSPEEPATDVVDPSSERPPSAVGIESVMPVRIDGLPHPRMRQPVDAVQDQRQRDGRSEILAPRQQTARRDDYDGSTSPAAVPAAEDTPGPWGLAPYDDTADAAATDPVADELDPIVQRMSHAPAARTMRRPNPIDIGRAECPELEVERRKVNPDRASVFLTLQVGGPEHDGAAVQRSLVTPLLPPAQLHQPGETTRNRPAMAKSIRSARIHQKAGSKIGPEPSASASANRGPRRSGRSETNRGPDPGALAQSDGRSPR